MRARLSLIIFTCVLLIAPSAHGYDICPNYERGLPSDVEVVSIEIKLPGELSFHAPDGEVGVAATYYDTLTPAMPERIMIVPSQVTGLQPNGTLVCHDLGTLLPKGTFFKVKLKHSRSGAQWGSVSTLASEAWANYGSEDLNTENEIEIIYKSGTTQTLASPAPVSPWCSNTFTPVDGASSLDIYLAGSKASAAGDAQRVVASGLPFAGGVPLLDFLEDGLFSYETQVRTCATSDGEFTAVQSAFFPLRALASFGLTADVLSVFDSEILPLAFSLTPQQGLVPLSFEASPSYGEFESADGVPTSDSPTGIFFRVKLLNDGLNSILGEADVGALAKTKSAFGLKKSALQAIRTCTKGARKKAKMRKGASFKKKGNNISCKLKRTVSTKSVGDHLERKLWPTKAESRLYKNPAFPFIRAAGTTCSEEQKKDTRFTLRLILNGLKAVAMVPNGVMTGTIKGSTVSMSSRKESGDVADGSWSIVEQSLKLTKVTSSMLQAAYQFSTTDQTGTCQLLYRGTLRRS